MCLDRPKKSAVRICCSVGIWYAGNVSKELGIPNKILMKLSRSIEFNSGMEQNRKLNGHGFEHNRTEAFDFVRLRSVPNKID